MEITTLDLTISIDIDPEQRIGVLLSGGMDSAILLFLILTDIKNRNLTVDLTVYNVPNINDNAVVHSRRVVDYLEKYFDTVIPLVNIGVGDANSRQLVDKPARQLVATGQVDLIYSGQNQFPAEATSWDSYKQAHGTFVRRSPDSPTVAGRYPFIRLQKDHILEIYRQFDLLEFASITHSCTARTQGKCNECLWCVERAWAFTKLGLTDL